MKWYGIVSSPGITTMAAAMAVANTASMTSTASGRVRKPCSGLRRSRARAVSGALKLVTDMAHRLNNVDGKSPAKPGDARVHHVRPGIEVVAPELRQQLLPRAHATSATHQVGEEVELTVRELDGFALHGQLTPSHVQDHRTDAHDILVVV